MTISNYKKNKAHSEKLKRSKGFTIVESLVAIIILIFAVTGVASAIQISISSYIFSRDQIIAFYLAQEGFEQIRNIRDENRLKLQPSWLTGIAAIPSDPCYFGKACTVDPVNSNNAIECVGGPDDCQVLKQNVDTGFYGYEPAWSDTIFKRKIVLTRINDKEISILVTVDWSKGIVDRQFRARENLFNWQ